MNRTRKASRRVGLRALAVAASILCFAAFAPDQAFARGGFKGGGFRSAPSIRSSSVGRSSSSGRTLSWGSATRPAPAASSSKSPAPASRFAAPGSSAGTRSSLSSQRSLYDSARTSGTLFSSRDQAAQSFRTSYGSQYKSSFASEPASRPDYIPSTAYVGSRPVNIVYNQGLGGYGYYNPSLGTWMLYDALSDAAMMGSLMNRHNYYYGPAPVYLSHGGGFLAVAIFLFLGFIMLVVVLRVLHMARARR